MKRVSKDSLPPSVFDEPMPGQKCECIPSMMPMKDGNCKKLPFCKHKFEDGCAASWKFKEHLLLLEI